MSEPVSSPPLRTWRPMVLWTAGMTLIALAVGTGCGPAPAAPDRNALAQLVRQLGPALYNYVLDARRVEAQGFTLVQMEKAVEGRFGPRLLRKTRRGDLVVFQSEEEIPDFGIAILTEHDGRNFAPPDFGDILIFPPR